MKFDTNCVRGECFNLNFFLHLDKFQLSNSGLVADSDGDENEMHCEEDHMMMASREIIQPSMNDTASMCTSVSDAMAVHEVQAQATSQSFQGHSDTGYQSQMTTTFIGDISSMTDAVKHEDLSRRQINGNMSPPKNPQGDWEPPSSSTPNKHTQNNEMHLSNC